jgi:hypothetical protein
MQRAIRNLGLYYYNSPPPPQAAMLQAFDWLSLTRTRIYLIRRVEVRIAREGAWRSNSIACEGARCSNLRRLREKCIMSGSPLCRGLTRATYILSIEHPRPKRLSRESNPGPPTMQANTLCKEPFERGY